MTRQAAAELRPTDYVWLSSTWRTSVLPMHVHRKNDDSDVEITRIIRGEERTAVLPAWCFTRCGVLTCTPSWEPGWSETYDPPRFAAGPSRGEHLPVRLLNPDSVRPCRRCFATSE